MTKYDVAAGVSLAGLNAMADELFKLPAAKKGLFTGTKTERIKDLGEVTVTYQVNAVPTFSFEVPTAEQWATAEKITPTTLENSGTPRPTENVVQVTFPDVSGKVTISGADQPANGKLVVIGVVKTKDNAASIEILAVDIDESNFTAWDKVIINQMLIPQVLEMANGMLKGIPIPKIPEFAGLAFQALALDVEPGGIVLGSTLTGGGTTDLSGFVFPSGEDVFALTKLSTLNTLADKNVKSTYKEEDSSGGSAFKASGRVTAKEVSLKAEINDQKKFVVNVKGKFSAFGELSGTGVGVTKAVMCPIGAAADAIADPSGWDKVSSLFGLGVSPMPLPIPIAFAAAAPSADGKQEVSANVNTDSIANIVSLSVTPKWSGSVTGSALASAASAFAALIPTVFERMILKDVLSNEVSPISFELPKMSESISLSGGAKITATLTLDSGAALEPHGTDELLQGLNLSLS